MDDRWFDCFACFFRNDLSRARADAGAIAKWRERASRATCVAPAGRRRMHSMPRRRLRLAHVLAHFQPISTSHTLKFPAVSGGFPATWWLRGGYVVVTWWLRGGYVVVTQWLHVSAFGGEHPHGL